MSHRIPAVIALSAILLATALLSASCGPEGDIRYETTSPALGQAGTGHLPVAQQLGDAAVSYLRGEGDLAALKQLVARSAQDGLAEMLSLLSGPTGCTVLGGTAIW